MNHLKHIRGISVRASSNAALPLHYKQHADVHFENRRLKCQLLRPNPLSIAKRSHVDIKCSGQFRQDSLRLVSKESKTICKQRNKIKSSVTSLKKKSSMHKKLPSENMATKICHYSTCQNAKFTYSNGINKPLVLQGDAITSGAKTINRHSSFVASVEKHPRSYAEMITDYSESLYKEFTAKQNDSFNVNNTMRKSPFSTFSVPPPARRNVNVAEYNKLSSERQQNDFSPPVKSYDLCNRYNNVNTIECYNFQHHGTPCAAETMNKSSIDQSVTANNLKSDDQSYAKLVADCSKSMYNIPIMSVLNNGLAPRIRNVPATDSSESVAVSRKDSTAYTQKKSQEITSRVSAIPLAKNVNVIDLEENDRLREMENVTSDSKSMTEERKVEKVVPKMKESGTLQPVDARDNSLDGVHGFAEPVKSDKEKDTAMRKSSCRSNNYQSNKIDRMKKRKKDFELHKHNFSHSSDKTSRLPQHFGSAAESSAIRRNSTHVSSSGNTGVLKQPQVKLRMVPSEKESIVSINVDQASIGSLDPRNSTSKHLSVVVQSDQKEDLQLTDNQWNAPTLRSTTKSAQRNDFGPMRISISEDSAPVKQIEFSINGKPVSELKSITARAERLDVVSSMDKIEIRIPFAKDDSSASNKIRETDLSKGVSSNIEQILNVQISANFRNESTKGSRVGTPVKAIQHQYGKGTIARSSSSISKTPYLINNFSKIREKTLNNYIQQYKFSKQVNIKFNDDKSINKYKISGDFDIQRKATKNVSTGKTMTDISLNKEVNNVEAGSLNMRKANTAGFPEANKYNKNESFDNRITSKTIPWWSSSDSFAKIRKKEDDHRSLIPPSNRNNHKASSNFNQNLITETLSKSKEITSNLKVLTKKTQSTNKTTTTNDSSNITSHSNSMKPHEESKPTRHHACSFRLKPTQGNSGIIPEIIRNDLKAEDNQVLTANKDINKISGVKQTKSITLFKSNRMNVKAKHDINVKQNTSVLHRKIKPSSAQNLSSEKNQKKKNNYSLKQTRSIDDVSKNIKSKIIGILDVKKPIEKKENNILVDYNLKREMLSRERTVILNSGIKNAYPVITTNDLTSNSSTAEIVSKKINNTKLTKQTESKEELKTKMNILLKEKEKDLSNDMINIKTLNKNDVKNIKEVHKNDFLSSNSSTFRNLPTQTLKKQEKLDNNSIGSQDKSEQNLKSLLEADENGHNPLLNIRISSGMMQRSETLGTSEKILLEEAKQNRPESLTSIKNTPETIQVKNSEKLKSSISSKLVNSFEDSSETTVINKLQTIKQITKPFKNTNKIANMLSSSQTIFNSKAKDPAGSKNLADENLSETSITQFLKTKKADMIARIVAQNPKNTNPSKDCEENFNKSGKGNLSGSADSSRKLNDSVGFKSAGSKTKFRVINNNCTYERKLFMDSFYSNFNRKIDIMSNSQSSIFKVQQNLNDMLKHPAPTVSGCERSWINTDRPEKSILYSVWLQRSENDIKRNGKLF